MAETVVENEYNTCVNTLGSTHSTSSEDDRKQICHFIAPSPLKEILDGNPIVVTPRLVNLTISSVITLSAIAVAVVVSVVAEATRRNANEMTTTPTAGGEQSVLLPNGGGNASAKQTNHITAVWFMKVRQIAIIATSVVVAAQLVGTVYAWENISEIDVTMLAFPIIAMGMTILVIQRFVPDNENSVNDRIEKIMLHAGDGCMETILLFSCIVQPLVYVAVVTSEYSVTNVTETVSGALVIFSLFASMYMAESQYGKFVANPNISQNVVKSVTTSIALMFSALTSFVLFLLCMWFLQATTKPFGLFDFSLSRWNNGMLLVNALFPILFIGRWALLPYTHAPDGAKKLYYTNLATLAAFVIFYIYYAYIVVVGSFYQKYDAA